MSLVVICGGVGAAKLLTGMIRVTNSERLIAIANVGDDLELHGLHISPDLDTIIYTTAGAVSQERGWGLEGETWQAMELLKQYGGADWFSLGDRDLGTHLYRTHRLHQGATLAEVTTELAKAWGLDFRLIPVTNDRLRTFVTTVDEGEITFQEYFVRRQHDVAVTAVRFEGADEARPAPGVIEAINNADRIVIAPSNPAVSIDPILAIAEVRHAIADRRSDVVAISPIIGGKALKGPADRLMTELGREASVTGVAQWYRNLISTLIIDVADTEAAPAIEALGVTPLIMPTVMTNPEITDALATAAARSAPR